MNQFYRTKSKELFVEFTRYLTEHPAFGKHIPKDAQVVLLDKNDPKYSLQAIKHAQNAKTTDDLPNRPVIYIEVSKMAPVKSRLRKVKITTAPPEYAVA